jgi:hypothetical protein
LKPHSRCSRAAHRREPKDDTLMADALDAGKTRRVYSQRERRFGV